MSYLKKIKSVFYGKAGEIKPELTTFDFVKTRKNILRELTLSKESENVIGVYCRAFGGGMFLTCVEDVNSETVVFHRYDMSGQKLIADTVSLDEIQMVLPFNKGFRNPFPLGKVQKITTLESSISVA